MKKKMSEFGGLECFWSDLSKHPTCPHGPMLLFGRHIDGELKQFYACSAFRDRKLCTSYADKDSKLGDARKKVRGTMSKKPALSYNHRKLFVRFNESMIQAPERRAYCHACEKLVLYEERQLHTDHAMKIGLSDEEMNNPTMILKPLSDAKKEAQYFFSKKATLEITNILVKAGARQILCIGAPRIHEHITQNFDHKMSSLLLDFDGRFHNFFGPLSYCWYNLFNNNFFTDEGAQTFRDFMTQNNGKDTYVICDPPFGGRVEPISQTLKTITDNHEKWNDKITDKNQELKILFVFPYFMESIIQRKSNPPGIKGGLSDLRMADYKVDYDNHPLFMSGSKGRKHGSPVRIFTNIELDALELPTEDGYRYCEKCRKWRSPENAHCEKCKSCTSKDGRRYVHCERCRRCVKPTWKHCDGCDRCALEGHECGEKPKITGRYFECGDSDRIGKDCDKIAGKITSSVRTSVKRKSVSDETVIAMKKRKSNTPRSTIGHIENSLEKCKKLKILKKGKTVDKGKTFEKGKIVEKGKIFEEATIRVGEKAKISKVKKMKNDEKAEMKNDEKIEMKKRKSNSPRSTIGHIGNSLDKCKKMKTLKMGKIVDKGKTFEKGKIVEKEKIFDEATIRVGEKEKNLKAKKKKNDEKIEMKNRKSNSPRSTIGHIGNSLEKCKKMKTLKTGKTVDETFEKGKIVEKGKTFKEATIPAGEKTKIVKVKKAKNVSSMKNRGMGLARKEKVPRFKVNEIVASPKIEKTRKFMDKEKRKIQRKET